jgi:SAM-dependent methyltransferase
MSWKNIAKTNQARVYIHPSGDNEAAWIHSGKESASLIQKYIPKPFKVMEYGCGTGRILQHLKECKVVGVDIAPEFVDECIRIGLDVKEVKHYQYKGDCDLIYAITVFIHLSKKDGIEALENIWKGLKPDGTALLQIPVYETSKEPNSWIDVGVWTEKELRDVCERVGFDIVELHTNKGEFSYENIGQNHDALQVLRKRNFKTY